MFFFVAGWLDRQRFGGARRTHGPRPYFIEPSPHLILTCIHRHLSKGLVQLADLIEVSAKILAYFVHRVDHLSVEGVDPVRKLFQCGWLLQQAVAVVALHSLWQQVIIPQCFKDLAYVDDSCALGLPVLEDGAELQLREYFVKNPGQEYPILQLFNGHLNSNEYYGSEYFELISCERLIINILQQCNSFNPSPFSIPCNVIASPVQSPSSLLLAMFHTRIFYESVIQLPIPPGSTREHRLLQQLQLMFTRLECQHKRGVDFGSIGKVLREFAGWPSEGAQAGLWAQFIITAVQKSCKTLGIEFHGDEIRVQVKYYRLQAQVEKQIFLVLELDPTLDFYSGFEASLKPPKETLTACLTKGPELLMLQSDSQKGRLQHPIQICVSHFMAKNLTLRKEHSQLIERLKLKQKELMAKRDILAVKNELGHDRLQQMLAAIQLIQSMRTDELLKGLQLTKHISQKALEQCEHVLQQAASSIKQAETQFKEELSMIRKQQLNLYKGSSSDILQLVTVVHKSTVYFKWQGRWWRHYQSDVQLAEESQVLNSHCGFLVYQARGRGISRTVSEKFGKTIQIQNQKAAAEEKSRIRTQYATAIATDYTDMLQKMLRKQQIKTIFPACSGLPFYNFQKTLDRGQQFRRGVISAYNDSIQKIAAQQGKQFIECLNKNLSLLPGYHRVTYEPAFAAKLAAQFQQSYANCRLLDRLFGMLKKDQYELSVPLVSHLLNSKIINPDVIKACARGVTANLLLYRPQLAVLAITLYRKFQTQQKVAKTIKVRLKMQSELLKIPSEDISLKQDQIWVMKCARDQAAKLDFKQMLEPDNLRACLQRDWEDLKPQMSIFWAQLSQ